MTLPEVPGVAQPRDGKVELLLGEGGGQQQQRRAHCRHQVPVRVQTSMIMPTVTMPTIITMPTVTCHLSITPRKLSSHSSILTGLCIRPARYSVLQFSRSSSKYFSIFVEIYFCRVINIFLTNLSAVG